MKIFWCIVIYEIIVWNASCPIRYWKIYLRYNVIFINFSSISYAHTEKLILLLETFSKYKYWVGIVNLFDIRYLHIITYSEKMKSILNLIFTFLFWVHHKTSFYFSNIFEILFSSQSCNFLFYIEENCSSKVYVNIKVSSAQSFVNLIYYVYYIRCFLLR